MSRDERQLAQACRALLATVHLERLWTDQGPTAEARALLDIGPSPLTRDERLALIVVSCLWRRFENEHLVRELANALDRLHPDPMMALRLLLVRPRPRASNSGGGIRVAAISDVSLTYPGELMKPLYTTTAVASGGHSSRVRSSDPPLDLAIAPPKSLGGPGGDGTNPEQLLAAGYAACFESALRLVAGMRHRTLDEIQITARLTLGQDERGAFQIAVTLQGRIAGVGREDAKALMEAAHEICPYSNATRGNVEVELVAEG